MRSGPRRTSKAPKTLGWGGNATAEAASTRAASRRQRSLRSAYSKTLATMPGSVVRQTFFWPSPSTSSSLSGPPGVPGGGASDPRRSQPASSAAASLWATRCRNPPRRQASSAAAEGEGGAAASAPAASPPPPQLKPPPPPPPPPPPSLSTPPPPSTAGLMSNPSVRGLTVAIHLWTLSHLHGVSKATLIHRVPSASTIIFGLASAAAAARSGHGLLLVP